MVKGSSLNVEILHCYVLYIIKRQVIVQHLSLREIVCTFVCTCSIHFLAIVGSDAMGSVLSACTMYDICTTLGLCNCYQCMYFYFIF